MIPGLLNQNPVAVLDGNGAPVACWAVFVEGGWAEGSRAVAEEFAAVFLAPRVGGGCEVRLFAEERPGSEPVFLFGCWSGGSWGQLTPRAGDPAPIPVERRRAELASMVRRALFKEVRPSAVG